MNIYSPTNLPPGFYVYAYIRSTDSDSAKAGTPYYIGKGKGKRAWSNKHSCSVPRDGHYIVIVSEGLTEFGALALERRLVRWYGRIDLDSGILRNRTDGGEGSHGAKRSEETKQKMAVARTGKHHTDQTKKIIGDKSKKKIYSEEYRMKLSITGVGRIRSTETKEKLSANAKNRWSKISPDERSLMLKTWMANRNTTNRVYQPLSDEAKRQISNTLKSKVKPTPIYCLTNDTRYDSFEDAAIKLGLNPKLIAASVRGHQKSTGGFTFAAL